MKHLQAVSARRSKHHAARRIIQEEFSSPDTLQQKAATTINFFRGKPGLCLTGLPSSLRMTFACGQEFEKRLQQARMSMVDGHPYKVEVGGSNPSVPTTG
jgi:hypothetical protein